VVNRIKTEKNTFKRKLRNCLLYKSRKEFSL